MTRLHYSLFQLSRPRFLSGSSRKHSQQIFFMLVGAPNCLAQFRIEHVFYREFAAREKSLFIHWNHRVPPCQGEESESIAPRRTSSSTCTGFLRRKARRPRTKAPPRLTHKMAEATGYSERTVRRIVSEKSAQSGAAFCSPAKRYKLDRKKIVLDDFDTEALRRVYMNFTARRSTRQWIPYCRQ